MYYDQYLYRHNHHDCNKHKDNMRNSINYATPCAQCPYMHICPFMQQAGMSSYNPMMYGNQYNSPIVNDFRYNDEDSENLFRHPYDHTSFSDLDRDDSYEYTEDYVQNYDMEDYPSYEYPMDDISPLEENTNEYFSMTPNMQFSLPINLPSIEDEEEDYTYHNDTD